MQRFPPFGLNGDDLVRRLSDQGGTSGPSPREAAFLATLTQAPAPGAGGRRHSVVTISRAPPTLFGRNRRESFAAFPTTGFPLARLARRDSSSSIARSPSGSGSSFNLQLDIMDDIAEIKARKVRMKMWKDSDSSQKMCEVQPLNGGQSARYSQSGVLKDRRYSDVSGLAQGQGPSKAAPRRASELPPIPSRTSTPPPPPPPLNKNSGIVISNNDLMSIMTSLTSSAQEISLASKATDLVSNMVSSANKSLLSSKRSLLKSSRSNSFDVSMLPGKDGKKAEPKSVPASWIAKRHQPLATKRQDPQAAAPAPIPADVVVTFTDKEKATKNILISNPPEKEPEERKPEKPTQTYVPTESGTHEPRAWQESVVDRAHKLKCPDDDVPAPTLKVVWDKPTGSTVDPALLGSVIEDFLVKKTSDLSPEAGAGSKAGSPGPGPGAVAIDICDNQPQSGSGAAAAAPAKGRAAELDKAEEEESEERCNSSLCSTIKDLFVK
ncbi:unnamed protein product [Bemisia tabaci]|uniref:Uncharacterized protein n=1 Tax=Bemisia tabaci TaxID=7038 RepID=A0A9P0A0I5_BEMTA|nr:unnamed protein product [Bemisia tabaci]